MPLLPALLYFDLVFSEIRGTAPRVATYDSEAIDSALSQVWAVDAEEPAVNSVP